jgi:hypothetical protein
VLLTLIAGGIGAVVSVMMRLTRGTLSLDGEAGTLITVLLGAFRPLTGGVFGLLTYVLLRGGLLTLTTDPPKGLAGSFYYTGLAFAAGFTERLAQIVPDVLDARQPASDPTQSRRSAAVVGHLREPGDPQPNGARSRVAADSAE